MKRIEDEPWYSQNAVPMRPFEWAVHPFQDDPIELVSYPWYDEAGDWMVAARIKLGNPSTIKFVSAKDIRTIVKEKHPHWDRPRRVVDAGWVFEDELS